MDEGTKELNQAIDGAELLFKNHSIETVATYDTVPLEVEVGITSALGRRYFELIHKLDQLMPCLLYTSAFELHRGESRVGIGRGLDIEFGLVQGIVALEGQALPARSHRDATGGVQAFREAEPEGCLLYTSRCV